MVAQQEIVSRAAAKAAGLKWYFTGVPCRNGHVAPRLVANKTCKECGNGSRRVAYWKDPEHFRALTRRYRSENLEKVKASAKLERQKNKSAYEKRYRKWSAANPERIAEHKQRWVERNPEKRRQAANGWVSRNLTKANEAWHRRRAQLLRAMPAWLSEDHLAQISAIHNKARQAGQHVDHIVPLNGETVCGLHVPWNLQVLRSDDNIKKSNRAWPDMP